MDLLFQTFAGVLIGQGLAASFAEAARERRGARCPQRRAVVAVVAVFGVPRCQLWSSDCLEQRDDRLTCIARAYRAATNCGQGIACIAMGKVVMRSLVVPEARSRRSLPGELWPRG